MKIVPRNEELVAPLLQAYECCMAKLTCVRY